MFVMPTLAVALMTPPATAKEAGGSDGSYRRCSPVLRSEPPVQEVRAQLAADLTNAQEDLDQCEASLEAKPRIPLSIGEGIAAAVCVPCLSLLVSFILWKSIKG